jgi:hypothetical protein
MFSRQSLLTPIALTALGLSGCGGSDKAGSGKPGEDPALTGALSGPVMTDPELFSQNNGTAAIAGGGPPVIELPPAEASPEAIAGAKADAEKAAGRRIEPAPSPAGEGDEKLREAVTAAQLASAVKGPGSDCGAKAEYEFGWSTRLPAHMPIYPRGHLVESAGTDRDGCRLRVAGFLTPVEANDIADFYHTRAKAAGYTTERHQSGDVQLLSGGKAKSAFAVRIRRQDDGISRVDIVANGG